MKSSQQCVAACNKANRVTDNEPHKLTSVDCRLSAEVLRGYVVTALTSIAGRDAWSSVSPVLLMTVGVCCRPAPQLSSLCG